MVAASIVILVMALSLLNLRGATGKANARGLASVIADQMRLARQEAMANQVPVAVCFPSQGRTRPHSQGFYVTSGNELPRMSRVVNFKDEFPRAVAFVGTWPESSGTLTCGPSLPGTKTGKINLTSWLNATMQDDYCFVFTPEGGVVTNGLPYFQGAYHVLVAAGVEFGSGSQPPGVPPVSPPAYFTPTALGETYTVSVSSSGAISLEQGVTGGNPSLIAGPTISTSVAPAALPPFDPGTTAQPVVADLQVYPKVDPSILPPNVDVMVPQDGHVTLVVTANDPSGQQLFLQWSCPDGTFSYPGEEKMQWNSARQAWVSYWQWRPPDPVAPGQQFTLMCSVRNLAGQVAVPAIPTSFNVGISPPGVICYQRQATTTTTNGYTGGYDIMVMDPDGGEARAVIQRNSFVPAPSVSRDGNKITWCEVGANGYPSGLYVANIDGSDPRHVYNDFGILPIFSPLGDKLAFIGLRNSDFTMSVIDTDGANRVDLDVVAVGGYGWDNSSWSPDGTKLVYQSQFAGKNGIWVAPVNSAQGSPQQILASSSSYSYGGTTNAYTDVNNPSWCPDSTNDAILYQKAGQLLRMTSTGTQVPFPQALNGYQASFSPDGSEILLGNQHLYRINSLGTGGLKQITNSKEYVNYPSWGP